MQPLITNTRDKISDNFYHYEVVRSSTANRLGLDNNVYQQDVVDNAKALAINVSEKIRDQYGPYTPSSWYRGEPLEYTICARAFRNWCANNGYDAEAQDAWASYFRRKQHPKGCAMDFEILGVSNDEVFEWCKENLEFDQLIREFAKKGDPMSGWIHISWDRFGANRNQAFHIT